VIYLATLPKLITNLTKKSEQDIGVEGSFVSLVHDDDAVVVEVRLAQRFSQQYSIGHVLDAGFLKVMKAGSI
jgi:hypothetical protein